MRAWYNFVLDGFAPCQGNKYAINIAPPSGKSFKWRASLRSIIDKSQVPHDQIGSVIGMLRFPESQIPPRFDRFVTKPLYIWGGGGLFLSTITQCAIGGLSGRFYGGWISLFPRQGGAAS